MKKTASLDYELVWSGKTAAVREEAACFRLLDQDDTDSCKNGALLSSSWRNLLIQGDNLAVLSSLRHDPLRSRVEAVGGIQLIYCDPPFAVGTDFYCSADVKSPDPPGAGQQAAAPSAAKGAFAYADTWGRGKSAFLSMMYERLLLMRRVLSPQGSLYLHCDWRASALLRLLLDEIFGPDRFLGEIVWHYTGGGRARRWFSRKHDSLLHYAASDRWTFNIDAARVPYKPSSGYAKGGITSRAGKRYVPNPLGTPADDVWDLPIINPLSKERLGYPTQKPESLLERVILASSNPGDLVADFFCGSGTTPAVADRLGRRWLAVDDSPAAVATTRARLDACADTAFDSLLCYNPEGALPPQTPPQGD